MPRLEKLSYFVNSQVGIIPVVANTGAIAAEAVDLSGGFDRCQHVVILGAFGTAAEFDMSITESETSGGTYVVITDSGVTQVTASAANKMFIVDVPVNNAKPYQKILSTAFTSTVGVAAVAGGYNGTRRLGTVLPDIEEEIKV